MAKPILGLILIAATLFLVRCDSYISAEDVIDAIHVTGKVMCQDCSLSYNKWVDGSRPIKGCIVSLTCMDERKRIMQYTRDETDERGEFDMTVNKFINGKELKPQLCTVRLVSSPDRSCNVPTDFGHGQTGFKLLRPFSVYRDLVKYVAGPFYYTTPMCEKPNTNEVGSNY